MARRGLCLMLLTGLASASPAFAGADAPSLAFWKVDSPAPEQRAVMVQISNPSAGPICIAHNFASLDRVTFWRNGKRLAVKRGGNRSRMAPGCALLPPGRSRTTLFRPWRSAALPAGAAFRMCYQMAWRNDARTGQDPDNTREICRAFR
jgi:hypothetical protein